MTECFHRISQLSWLMRVPCWCYVCGRVTQWSVYADSVLRSGNFDSCCAEHCFVPRELVPIMLFSRCLSHWNVHAHLQYLILLADSGLLLMWLLLCDCSDTVPITVDRWWKIYGQHDWYFTGNLTRTSVEMPLVVTCYGQKPQMCQISMKCVHFLQISLNCHGFGLFFNVLSFFAIVLFFLMCQEALRYEIK